MQGHAPAGIREGSRTLKDPVLSRVRMPFPPHGQILISVYQVPPRRLRKLEFSSMLSAAETVQGHAPAGDRSEDRTRITGLRALRPTVRRCGHDDHPTRVIILFL